MKGWLFLAIIVASVCGATHAEAASLAKPGNNLGLLGYWSFNEGVGATSTDFSGNGNHGPIVNGTWANPKLGKAALSFNGSNSYVNVGEVNGPTDEITIAAWINKSAHGAWRSILDRYASETSDCFSLGFDNSTGSKLMFMWDSTAPEWANKIVADSDLPLNEWVHVAVSSNGSTATFYVNGVADGSDTVGAPCTDGDVYIGVNYAGGDEYFSGIIDEVRLYSRALSAAEIRGLYTQPGTRVVGPTPGGLIGRYYDGVDFDTLISTHVDPTVDFNPADTTLGVNRANGGDTFSVRWTGFVQPEFSETYTFYTSADDGIRLWVNDTQLINDWTDHGVQENSGTIALQAGQLYPVTLEFYENGGGAAVWFSWSSASQSKEVIPAANLFSANRVTNANASSATLQGGGSLGQGLVGLWTFDGADTLNTITDRSGQSNHSYFVGGATSTAKTIGKMGQALRFDGVDDRIPLSTSFGQPSRLAVSLWFKTTASGQAFFGQANAHPPNAATNFIPTLSITSAGLLRGEFWTGSVGSITTAGSVADGQWHHAVLVGDATMQYLYLDGVLVNSRSGTINQTWWSTSQIGVGYDGANSRSLCTGWCYFRGELDDVRVYNRALTASEVKQLYNLGR